MSKDSWLWELIGIVTVTSELDDCLARREAKHAGLQVVGVAAIVGMAELQGLTPSARAVFDLLLQSDYRVGESVIENALRPVAAARVRKERHSHDFRTC